MDKTEELQRRGPEKDHEREIEQAYLKAFQKGLCNLQGQHGTEMNLFIGKYNELAAKVKRSNSVTQWLLWRANKSETIHAHMCTVYITLPFCTVN